MGGPGGHMWHPFDCPDVNSGKDLMDFFAKSVAFMKHNPAALKIDGVNLSFRLRKNLDMSPTWEFVVDRGATSGPAGKLDLKGVTADNAHKRFINKNDPEKPHGMVGATGTLLGILNSALSSIMPELRELGFLEEGGHGPYGLYFNTEFVLKKINVKEYPFNFIALHGIRQFTKKSDRARSFKDILVDQKILDKIRDKLHIQAMKHSPPFRVFSKIETNFSRDPDLQRVLETTIPINTGGLANQKSLGGRLMEVEKSPYGQKIILKEEVAAKLGIPQTQDPFAKKIYMAVHSGALIPALVANKDHIEPIVDAYVMQHAVRLIGNEILDASNSKDLGSAREQEGVVVGPSPLICGGGVFKYTGDFIVGGMASTFKTQETEDEGDQEEVKSSTPPDEGLLQEQAQPSSIKNVIAIYPGRFQPAGRHHAAAWTWLQTMFGANETYLATSDLIEPPRSPFTFHEKQEILKAHGVPDEKIVQTTNPYKAEEITSQYDPETTAVVFMIGKKDMGEDPRFKNVDGKLKSGEAAYYKDFEKNKGRLEPLSKHGYLITAPHISLNVPDHGEMSGTSLRKYLENASKEEFTAVMGFVDQDLYNMIQDRLKAANELPEEGELNENFLSMDSLYSLVDEALHEKYKNVLGLDSIVSLVDEAILEKKTKVSKSGQKRVSRKIAHLIGDEDKSREQAAAIAYSMEERGELAEDIINETTEEELNTNIKLFLAKILPRLVPNIDADKLAELGEEPAENLKDELMAVMQTAREETVNPDDVAKQMAEVSGGGVAGYAGDAWSKNKKGSRSWHHGK
jgi:hypothetical protein